MAELLSARQIRDMFQFFVSQTEVYMNSTDATAEEKAQWEGADANTKKGLAFITMRKILGEDPEAWYFYTYVEPYEDYIDSIPEKRQRGEGIRGGAWNMKPHKQYSSAAEMREDLNRQGSGLSSVQESIKADKNLNNIRSINKRSRIYI